MVRRWYSIDNSFYLYGMLQNWLFTLDSLLPLPAVGLGDFVEGLALHTSRKRVKLVWNMPRG